VHPGIVSICATRAAPLPQARDLTLSPFCDDGHLAFRCISNCHGRCDRIVVASDGIRRVLFQLSGNEAVALVPSPFYKLHTICVRPEHIACRLQWCCQLTMQLRVVKAVVFWVPGRTLLTTAIAPDVRLPLTRRQMSRPDVKGPTVHSSSSTLEPRSNLQREQPLLIREDRQQLPHQHDTACWLSSDAPASPCGQLCAFIKALPHL